MITQEKIKLSSLPWQENALAPYISAQTISFHYGKHHKKYVDTTNELIEKDNSFSGLSLEEIIVRTAKQKEKAKLFNNAAQVWNHDFYWKSMKPQGGGMPQGIVSSLIKDSFGDFASFKKKFIDDATAHFGSGYAWLIRDNGKLVVVTTHDAYNPLAAGQKALLTMDVWEHAYYLDYQNLRQKYAEAFLDHLINWSFVEENLSH